MTDDRIQHMLAIASGEVGYHEGRSGGHWNNRQKYAPEVPGLEWAQGQPWCAVFVYWCFLKAGVVDLLPTPRTAWVPNFITWAKKHGQWSEYPAVGAPVIFGGGKHIGIVESFTADTVTTIEGNTNSSGSAEGDGVYRKVHRRRDPWVTGYLYPKFADPLVSADPRYKPAQEAPVTTYPANVIDLVNYKLTKDDGKEVKQPALATYADAGFRVTESGDVAFRAKCGGGTTPHSTHTRYELREMVNQGHNLADWDNHHGTHEQMAAYRVEHLPKNKPEAVCMQIHDPKDDVVMVRLVGDPKNPLGPINVYAEWSKGKGKGSVKELLGTVHLGQKFYVRIVADAEGIRVRFQASGSSVVTERKRSTVRAHLFFKAGCYNQSDTDHDKASEYAEVVIYKGSLRVRHAA